MTEGFDKIYNNLLVHFVQSSNGRCTKITEKDLLSHQNLVSLLDVKRTTF